MAKLNGVKTIDMVGGEITKVEYDGAGYERVEGRAKSGDIVRVIDAWGSQKVGEYFEVISVTDDCVRVEGNTCSASCLDYRVEPFRKYSAPKGWKKGDKVRCQTSGEVVEVFAYKPKKRTVGGGKGDYFVGHEKGFTYIDESGYEHWTRIDKFEPMPTFREGDRVKTLARGEFNDIGKGEIGEITDILEYEGHPIRVSTDDDCDYFEPEDLELVEDKPKFEIGDYVVALPEANEEYSITTTDMKLGKVVEEDSWDSEDDIMIEIVAHKAVQTSMSFSVNSKYFRKATEDEIAEATKPSEGDIVVITANTNHSLNTVGDTGVVAKISRNGNPVAQVDVPGRPKVCNWTLFSEMRPATDEEKSKYEKAKAKSEFKVGDVVKMTADRNEHRFGDIKVIREFDEEDSVYPIGFNDLDGSHGGWANYDIIEKVSEEDAKFAKLGRKTGEFKKGDIVRVTNGYCEVKDGDIGEVTKADGSKFPGVTARGMQRYVAVELIAPVESRADLD